MCKDMNSNNERLENRYEVQIRGGILTLNCLTHDHNFSLQQDILDVPLDTMN